MSPRCALLLVPCCVALLGTALLAQSTASAAATTTSPAPPVARPASPAARPVDEVGSRGPSRPAGRKVAVTPKAGKAAAKPRGAAGRSAPVGKAADCDVAETPVKAAPAPLPATADLLTPSVAPCPPGQSAAGKP